MKRDAGPACLLLNCVSLFLSSPATNAATGLIPGITLIGGFKDPKNFGAGYKYLVNMGDAYVVRCVTGLDR